MSDPTPANRRHWNAISAAYLERHVGNDRVQPKAWGAWSVPEAELGALGDLAGLSVLELGCGGAQWSGTLEAEDVAVVGLDLSEAQLSGARRRCRTLALVQANGAVVPFRRSCFDLVFCDHGAMSWADPERTVPEVARVLRPDGRLVFNCASPWLVVCHDADGGLIDDRLHGDYFGMTRVEETEGAASFALGYGDWIRLFRRHGLVVEDLIEPRPPADATNGFYAMDPPDWHHRWPAETIWVTRKVTGPARSAVAT